MKAFVIDPQNQTITEQDYSGVYTDIYRLGQFETFDMVILNDANDGIYVDDEGLFNEDYHTFGFRRSGITLAGRGVVIGCDSETGESRDANVTLQWLREHVIFHALC